MVHLYEKVCKDNNNPYGIKEIIDENPLINGPCVITMIAIPDKLKYINGCMRLVANLINPDIDTNYDPNRRILGIGYGDKRNPSVEELNEFVIKYFYPLINENDTIQTLKNFRNLTFLTYCNGSKNYIKIERKIVERLKELNYREKDINLILSQICLAQITGNYLQEETTKTTAMLFGDKYDTKFAPDQISRREITQRLKYLKTNYGIIKYDDMISFVSEIKKDNDLYRYLRDDTIMSNNIREFLCTSLENAIDNKYYDLFVPITYRLIEDSMNNLNNREKMKIIK